VPAKSNEEPVGQGVPIPPDMEIDINTLSNALIRGQLNDLSFTVS